MIPDEPTQADVEEILDGMNAGSLLVRVIQNRLARLCDEALVQALVEVAKDAPGS